MILMFTYINVYILERRIEGKLTRGRKRVVMVDDVREGNPYETLKRKAQDRADCGSWTSGTCLTAEHY